MFYLLFSSFEALIDLERVVTLAVGQSNCLNLMHKGVKSIISFFRKTTSLRLFASHQGQPSLHQKV
jgi:hypothetical protein